MGINFVIDFRIHSNSWNDH